MQNLAPLDASGMQRNATKVREWAGAAVLWDIGDGTALFELARPDALISPEVIAALGDACTLVVQRFASLVLTSNDPRLFAFGAAGPFRHTIVTGDTAPSLAFLLDGQRVLHTLRSARFPIVVAVHGLAFSGACEVALFANGLVVEEAAPIALKEIWVGLIPGWGGCCQLMLRQQLAGLDPLAAAQSALSMCARGHIAQGEVEGRKCHLLRPHDRTVRERAALIPAAKALAQELTGTAPPSEAVLRLPPSAAAAELKAHVARLDDELSFATAEAEAMQTLLDVITATPGEAVPELEYMAREARAFLPLLKPRLGPRFAHLATTGQRPPRDA